MPVFDPNVFDFGGFDANFATPVMFRFVVPSEMRKVAPGSAVTIFVYVKNVSTTQGRDFLMNVDAVQLALRGPGDIDVLTLTAMQNQATGLYAYTHQLTTNDAIGFYAGRCIATNGDRISETPFMKLFEVIKFS